MITKDEILKTLSGIKGLIEYKPVKLAHGGISDYYIQIKRSYGEPGILKSYTNLMTSLLGLELQNFSCIVSSGYGGTPLATALFLHLEMWNIKLSLLRDSPEEYGTLSMFSGYPPEELSKRKKVAIVDDVFTTGGSIKKIMKALPKDLTVGRIIVVCNRSKIKRPMINGIEVEYLFTVEELMEAMKK